MDYDLDLTLDLLREVLPSERWDDDRFLDWFYFHNPNGPMVPSDVDADGRRICHIGGVPIRLRSGTHDGTFLILLNSSAAPDAQGSGLYVKTLFNLADIAKERGLSGLLGVTNARSTGPAVRGFKATMRGALPAKAVVPRSLGRSVRSIEVTPDFLASDEFTELTADLDEAPAVRFTQRWTTDVLRWRLGAPGRRYVVHVSDELFAVSLRTSIRRLPVTVLLKLLPRGGHPGPFRPHAIVGAACRHHRTPLAVYVGYNAHVPVPGFRISPDRLPAPLNLLVMSTTDALDDDDFRFETFEFLDFDAY